jgi:hypothetical protein
MDVKKIAVRVALMQPLQERRDYGSAETSPQLNFSGIDKAKITEFDHLIDDAYQVMEELVGGAVEWPTQVEAMTDLEITNDESLGGGHGRYNDELIKINPHMKPFTIFYNFIHENLHHALPDASEEWVDALTDVAYDRIMADNPKSESNNSE